MTGLLQVTFDRKCIVFLSSSVLLFPVLFCFSLRSLFLSLSEFRFDPDCSRDRYVSYILPFRFSFVTSNPLVVLAIIWSHSQSDVKLSYTELLHYELDIRSPWNSWLHYPRDFQYGHIIPVHVLFCSATSTKFNLCCIWDAIVLVGKDSMLNPLFEMPCGEENNLKPDQ